MSSYFDELKSPKWQKRRLKILERDGFKCTSCDNEEKELHVHHLEYGKTINDVSDHHLVTLCEDCHKNQEKLWKIYKSVLKKNIGAPGFPLIIESIDSGNCNIYELAIVDICMKINPEKFKQFLRSMRSELQEYYGCKDG